MLLSSSPPPSTLSAFVGLLKFVVGRLLSYRDPRNINKNAIVDDRFEVGRWTEVRSSPGSCKHKLRTPDVVGQKRFLLGTDLKNASTTTRLMKTYIISYTSTVVVYLLCVTDDDAAPLGVL
ncbi:hypothetical protein DY000_02062246 [Brassica cretica]|uniref:Uncharacterized protein n=1 Tax=Brassica cretica TaxID=69181 RepID=A0ABQ7B1G4_BRACR|nr:hypothetical protein DY000_02062246 [Brassica cretica]